MCYQDKNCLKGTEELTSQEWINFIRQIPRYTLVTLIGGEPLVHPFFKEIAKEALAHHSVNLVTNGVLLNEQIAKFLINNKLLLLGVSLDGVGGIHDRMRGVPGTYDKIINNIIFLQKEKKRQKVNFPLLDIKTVVTEDNLGGLEELFRVVSSLEADFFTISLPKVSENQFNPKLNKCLNNLLPMDFSLLEKINFAFLKQVLNKIIFSSHKTKTKVRFYPEFKSVGEISKRLYDPKLINKNFIPCQQPWSGVQISATGDVYPCLSLKMGNIKEQSFSQIWNGEKFVNFRKSLKDSKLFSACVGCCYLKQLRINN
jgi:MoaA/NifB/PqqE/SkfB family radical SAM enzyme